MNKIDKLDKVFKIIIRKNMLFYSFLLSKEVLIFTQLFC
jgi:hypothetical protein